MLEIQESNNIYIYIYNNIYIYIYIMQAFVEKKKSTLCTREKEYKN